MKTVVILDKITLQIRSEQTVENQTPSVACDEGARPIGDRSLEVWGIQ